MRHYEIALRDDSFDLDAKLGELSRESLHELHECVGSVWSLGVVLDVLRTHVLGHCFFRLLVVEGKRVVAHDFLLVLFN